MLKRRVDGCARGAPFDLLTRSQLALCALWIDQVDSVDLTLGILSGVLRLFCPVLGRRHLPVPSSS